MKGLQQNQFNSSKKFSQTFKEKNPLYSSLRYKMHTELEKKL